MAAISETLRQARLRSGVDLDRLAAKTKINPRYLEAIEKGDFDKLPGGIFARMFIKQYADAVGLDGASFAEEFQRNSSGAFSEHNFEPISRPRSSFQPSVPGFSSIGGRDDRLTNMLSSLIWVVAAILVCAAAYYGLAHLPSRPAATPPAETMAAKADKPAGPVVKPSATSAAAGPAATVPPPPSPTGEAQKAAQASTPTATNPATAPAPDATSASLPIQLTLTATDAVWVTAVADGKTVVSELMPAGSSKIISASKGARIRLGNAGGMDITFNGKKLEPFGPKGQVRTIDFSSFGAQVVSRTPPNPDPLR